MAERKRHLSTEKRLNASILDYPFNSLHNNVAYGSYLFKRTPCINKEALEHGH